MYVLPFKVLELFFLFIYLFIFLYYVVLLFIVLCYIDLFIDWGKSL